MLAGRLGRARIGAPSCGARGNRHARGRAAAVLLAVVATLLGGALCAVLAAAVVVGGGRYDVAATSPHWPLTYTLLETTMRQSVRWRARGIAEPAADEAAALRGAACYRVHCAQCHGGPGVAPEPLGRGMQPLPGPLVDAAHRWRPRELYWITRHGIRMSGMPAWQQRMDDAALWDTVAFLRRLPGLDAAAYAGWLQRAPQDGTCAPPDRGAHGPADAERGRRVLPQYACNACHVIPGVTGPRTHVGPPLVGFGGRGLVAGTLPNSPANTARWLLHTQQVKPGTAMPAMGLTPRDARDIAAYLATLR